MTVGKIEKLITLLNERFIGSTFWKYWLIALILFIVLEIALKIMNGRHPRRLGQRTAISLLIPYVFLTYAYTVLLRETGSGYSIELTPFWSYLIVIREHSELELFWILVNLVMLVPFGFLLPCCFRKRPRWWCVFLTGLAFSFSIELSQLLLQKGNFELFDDPINNIFGCMVGFGIYCLFHHREKRDEEA